MKRDLNRQFYTNKDKKESLIVNSETETDGMKAPKISSTCYYCGKNDHIDRKCRKRKFDQSNGVAYGQDQRLLKSEVSQTGQVNILHFVSKNDEMPLTLNCTSNNEAGIFVHTNIQSVKAKPFAHTGSFLTTISKQLYDNIPSGRMQRMKPFIRTIEGAGGLDVDG